MTDLQKRDDTPLRQYFYALLFSPSLPGHLVSLEEPFWTGPSTSLASPDWVMAKGARSQVPPEARELRGRAGKAIAPTATQPTEDVQRALSFPRRRADSRECLAFWGDPIANA